MKKIIEVLRLKHEANLSHEKISRSCQLSKGVVSKYHCPTGSPPISACCASSVASPNCWSQIT